MPVAVVGLSAEKLNSMSDTAAKSVPDLALPLVPTVTVTSPAPLNDACMRAVTVTVVAPAASPRLEGLTERVIGLAAVALTSVMLVPVIVCGEPLPSTEIVSLDSESFLSEFGIIENVAVPVESPLAIVRLKSLTVG